MRGKNERSNKDRSLEILEGAGYKCVWTPNGGSGWSWHIIGISGRDVILVHVRTGGWPTLMETVQMRLFITPANVRKLIHRWDKHQPPHLQVREL